jgi:hypothetical protein
MGKQNRKRIDAESEIGILQSHLMDKRPVSEMFEEHGIQPSLFYQGFIGSLERASGSELIDYRSFGKRYSLNEKGQYEGQGLADDVYWRTLRDEVAATPGIVAIVERVWNATNLHDVRFARGYGCQLYRELRHIWSQVRSA